MRNAGEMPIISKQHQSMMTHIVSSSARQNNNNRSINDNRSYGYREQTISNLQKTVQNLRRENYILANQRQQLLRENQKITNINNQLARYNFQNQDVIKRLQNDFNQMAKQNQQRLFRLQAQHKHKINQMVSITYLNDQILKAQSKVSKILEQKNIQIQNLYYKLDSQSKNYNDQINSINAYFQNQINQLKNDHYEQLKKMSQTQSEKISSMINNQKKKQEETEIITANSIRNLQQQIHLKNQEIQILTQHKTNLMNEIQKLVKKINQKENERTNIEKKNMLQITSLKNNIDFLNQDLTNQQRYSQQLEKQRQEMKKIIAYQTAQIQQFQKGKLHLNKQVKELFESLKQQQIDKKRLCSQNQQQNTQITQLQKAIINAQNQYRLKQSDYLKLQLDFKKIQAQRKELQKTNSTQLEEITHLFDQLNKLTIQQKKKTVAHQSFLRDLQKNQRQELVHLRAQHQQQVHNLEKEYSAKLMNSISQQKTHNKETQSIIMGLKQQYQKQIKQLHQRIQKLEQKLIDGNLKLNQERKRYDACKIELQNEVDNLNIKLKIYLERIQKAQQQNQKNIKLNQQLSIRLQKLEGNKIILEEKVLSQTRERQQLTILYKQKQKQFEENLKRIISHHTLQLQHLTSTNAQTTKQLQLGTQKYIHHVINQQKINAQKSQNLLQKEKNKYQKIISSYLQQIDKNYASTSKIKQQLKILTGIIKQKQQNEKDIIKQKIKSEQKTQEAQQKIFRLQRELDRLFIQNSNKGNQIKQYDNKILILNEKLQNTTQQKCILEEQLQSFRLKNQELTESLDSRTKKCFEYERIIQQIKSEKNSSQHQKIQTIQVQINQLKRQIKHTNDLNAMLKIKLEQKTAQIQKMQLENKKNVQKILSNFSETRTRAKSHIIDTKVHEQSENQLLKEQIHKLIQDLNFLSEENKQLEISNKSLRLQLVDSLNRTNKEKMLYQQISQLKVKLINAEKRQKLTDRPHSIYSRYRQHSEASSQVSSQRNAKKTTTDLGSQFTNKITTDFKNKFKQFHSQKLLENSIQSQKIEGQLQKNTRFQVDD